MTLHYPAGESDFADFWPKDQLHRRRLVESGQCVVASMRKSKDGRLLDGELISWAVTQGKFVRIDRKSEWRNPFHSPADGDHETVCKLFAEKYWPNKKQLRIKSHQLSGKVLGCWCYPMRCHGNFIAEFVNSNSDIYLTDYRSDNTKGWAR